jgi:hypothetical protein
MDPNATYIVLNATLNQPSQASQALWKDLLPSIILILAAFVSILTWFLNEWSKRRDQKIQLKFERYTRLIEALSGYFEPRDKELQKKFKNELNLCWLHCPDDVIRKATDFFDVVEKNSGDKDRAAIELLLAIRKTTPFKKTALKSEDFIYKYPRIISLKGESASQTGAKAKPQNNKWRQHKERCWWQFWK